MIRGLSRIVPNVVGGLCLAIGFLIVQPATAEEKPKAAARGERRFAFSTALTGLVRPWAWSQGAGGLRQRLRSQKRWAAKAGPWGQSL